jgi:drug/metabolite transporter (DMT)-like permease
MAPDRVARWVALPLSVAAISTSGILIRFTTAPPLQTAAYRMTITGLLLLGIAVATQRREIARLGGREWGLLVGAGVVLGIHFALWTNALFMTSVASAVLLVDTHPVIVALGGLLFLGERPALAVWVAIGLTLLGSVVIGAGDLDVAATALVGDAMALGAALTFAIYLLIGRRVRPILGLASYTGLVYSLAGLSLIIMALVSGVALLDVEPHDAVVWLLLVLLPTLGGHTVINWTLRYLPVSIVGVSILGEPLVTTMLAWLILHEPPATAAVIGGAMTLTGVALALRAESPTDVKAAVAFEDAVE